MKKIFQIIAIIFIVFVSVVAAYETTQMIVKDFQFERVILAIALYACVMSICVKVLEEIKKL